MDTARLRVLIGKEFLDIARNRTALVPVVVVTLVSLAMPLGIVIVVPSLTGQALADDGDLARLSRVAGGSEVLSAAGRIPLFLFEQFLLMFLVTPVTGAMALASHAIVGEKQARTLEPLLATPVTTIELLTAKVLGALLPTLAISVIGLGLYLGAIAWFAAPGVGAAMASVRTLLLTVLVAPAAALVSLQAAILISSRVNDPRTAQQFGALIIVPLIIVMVMQFSGSLWLSTAALALSGVGLFAVW